MASNFFGTTKATLTLKIRPENAPGPLIVSSTSATGRTNMPFSFQVISTGATSSATVTATGLPPGLKFDPVSGVISGTPAADGSSSVVLTLTDGNTITRSTLQLTFTSDPALPVITSASRATIVPGQAFSYTIIAPSTLPDPISTKFAMIGDLPAGLGFDPSNGTISGTSRVLAARRAGDTGSASRTISGPPGDGGGNLSGGVITNVQLFASNPAGTSTLPLVFYLAPKGVVNISTRLPIATGDNVLIAGFILDGNAPKKLIFRAIVVEQIEPQTDGKLLIAGTFEAFNGVAAPGIASLNADGSVDSAFVAPAVRDKFDYFAPKLERQADGSFLLSGPYRLPNAETSASLIHILAPPVITSPLNASGTVGQQFVYQYGTAAATSLGVTNLPPGLSFKPELRAIVGTPTAAGTFAVGLSATNSVGTTTATLTITIRPASAGPVIISSTSATGRAGVPFRFQVITSGATSNARLSASGLPPGLTIDAVTGVISGMPASDGSFPVELTVTDGNATAKATLQLTFTADPAVPVIVSANEARITPGEPFLYKIVAPTSTPNDPVTYTLIGDLPQGLSFDSAAGVISGIYSPGPPRKDRGGDGGGGPNPLSEGVITNVQLFASNSAGTATKPLPFFLAPSGVVNISTRIFIGTDDKVLIAGFIITGNTPKKIILRGIAPSLKSNGVPVPGTLQDPAMELRAGATLIGSNDDWREAQENEIIETGIAPPDDREPAIIAVLNPGFYTAVMKGKGPSTGIGLVELYDLGTASLDTGSAAKLANISTRGLVQSGDNLLIGGFIVTGGTSRVILRATGPSLSDNGVQDALQDTTLDLVNGNGSLIVTNDDWRTGGQEQQIIDTQVPPKDDRESAVVANLNSGAYTAVVRGKGGLMGIALIEAYVLQ